MTFWERIDQFWIAFYAAMGTGAAGAVIWVIRTIFTNKKVAEAAQAQVEALRKEIEVREETRKGERAAFQRLEERLDEGLREVREDVKTLLQRGEN